MTAQRLSELCNLGPRSEEMLAAIGIRTPNDLARRGSLDAFIALKQAGVSVSLNLLWAMEGALSDRDWRKVVLDDKLRLLTELEARGVNI